MRKWNMVLVLAAISLLPVLPASVFAEDGTGLTLTLSANRSSASVGDNLTYTYFISNTGKVTVNNLELEDEMAGEIGLPTIELLAGDNITAYRLYTIIDSDLPGPLVTSANVTATDPDDQVVSAMSNSVAVVLTAADDDDSDDVPPLVRTKAWILRQLGVPGKGIDHAPGLQKPFNPKSQAAKKFERFMERHTVRENAEVKVKNKNKNK